MPINDTGATITTENLVNLLSALTRRQPYSYINGSTHTVVAIESIDGPRGPIVIRRWDPTKGETFNTADPVSMSAQMLTRVANAVSEGTPINIDRLLGASYNSRSALETLLCHTPPFYYCFPGRIDFSTGKAKIKHGHKHIIFLPDSPHDLGILTQKEIENLAINEIPGKNVVYNALELPPRSVQSGSVDTTEARIHLQMQMAVYEIGRALGLKTFIAQNDQGAMYKGKVLSDHEDIITDLSSVPVVGPFNGAANAGKLIDAIWFGSRNIPAIFEVENSTGVTSGLTRMQNFMKLLPPYQDMRFVIIAPDDLRDKVVREVNKPEFNDLKAFYMPYSSVSELLGLCQERKLKGVSEAFIETFLEDVYSG